MFRESGSVLTIGIRMCKFFLIHSIKLKAHKQSYFSFWLKLNYLTMEEKGLVNLVNSRFGRRILVFVFCLLLRKIMKYRVSRSFLYVKNHRL